MSLCKYGHPSNACPLGYPGCACVDDAWREEFKKLEAYEAAQEPRTPLPSPSAEDYNQ